MTTVGSGHRRCRSEIVTSLNTQSNGFQRLKSQMQRVLNWGGNSQEDTFFNPEVLANQKHQWYQFHSQSSDIAKFQEPSLLFEHFIIAGIHPEANLEPAEDAFARRKKWESKLDKTELMDPKMMQFRSPPHAMMEPQIIFKYPPGKKLPMRLVDLASFCFPGGVKAHVLQRTPSLSELNQVIYGQEHLSRDDSAFIFSVKVGDNLTLYGVCLHTQEFVQRPPGIFGGASGLPRSYRGRSRFLVVAPRCYCLLTRVPFFDLHYSMLNSLVAQERLNRTTQFASHVPSVPKPNDHANENTSKRSQSAKWMDFAIPVDGAISLSCAAAGIISDDGSHSPSSSSNHNQEKQMDNYDTYEKRWDYLGKLYADVEACVCPVSTTMERLGSSGSLCSSVKSMESEDEQGAISCSDKDDSIKTIMEWAKENKNYLLQIVCSYHALSPPLHGGKIVFKPLEHLQAMEYCRLTVVLGESENNTDKVKFKLAAIEEAVALSNWTTATTCRVLSLQNVLILLTGVLLEKQVIITSPNLGVLSATVLSLIPMILPFEWQSLFLPVLPGKMFDFLDAPVPFVVGILQKPADNKMKRSNAIHVNLAINQVEMSSLPALPQQRELASKLEPLHARLSCEKSSVKKHPVYRCNKVQVEAASQFLNITRRHLESSLCSNLTNHAITSVQSNNDRVSLLLKESYVDSFPIKDREFIKQFVDTQMFTALSDTRLSRN